ncbi:hypothetical protein V9T40_009013 [Parthenolecanium corni]|uniref:Uncharacterized protein n=1 Tax=Parthenolecanium corni TaxID=536013 RepID=A0AAN9TPP0_9HEMI
MPGESSTIHRQSNDQTEPNSLQISDVMDLMKLPPSNEIQNILSSEYGSSGEDEHEVTDHSDELSNKILFILKVMELWKRHSRTSPVPHLKNNLLGLYS